MKNSRKRKRTLSEMEEIANRTCTYIIGMYEDILSKFNIDFICVPIQKQYVQGVSAKIMYYDEKGNLNEKGKGKPTIILFPAFFDEPTRAKRNCILHEIGHIVFRKKFGARMKKLKKRGDIDFELEKDIEEIFSSLFTAAPWTMAKKKPEYLNALLRLANNNLAKRNRESFSRIFRYAFMPDKLKKQVLPKGTYENLEGIKKMMLEREK